MTRTEDGCLSENGDKNIYRLLYSRHSEDASAAVHAKAVASAAVSNVGDGGAAGHRNGEAEDGAGGGGDE